MIYLQAPPPPPPTVRYCSPDWDYPGLQTTGGPERCQLGLLRTELSFVDLGQGLWRPQGFHGSHFLLVPTAPNLTLEGPKDSRLLLYEPIKPRSPGTYRQIESTGLLLC